MRYDSTKIHPKISDAVQNYITNKSMDVNYYGEMALFVNFIEEERLPTAGVNFTNYMNFYYNPKFIDSLNEKQLNMLMFHEFFHLLFDHPKRSASYDKKMANFAQDMIINDLLFESFPDIVEMPDCGGLHTPKEYSDEKVFEILYYWLMEKKEAYDKDNNSVSKELQDIFKNYDANGDANGETHGQGGKQIDVHMDSEVSDEMKNNIRETVKATLKNRGLQTSNIEKILDGLKKSSVDYLREIKRQLGWLRGQAKSKTFKRPNRRNISGTKGVTKVNCRINVILDTSGSMCNEFDHVLSYIFQNDIEINLVQCDTEVKSVQKIKNKNELKKLAIKGLGGTVLQPAVDHIRNHYAAFNSVILTDGYTDSLDFSGLKKILILSTEAVPSFSGTNAKAIVINKK